MVERAQLKRDKFQEEKRESTDQLPEQDGENS
jgi:hypothetical protein